MSKVTLLKGDCLELMKDIPNKSVDMILCYLPYGTTAGVATVNTNRKFIGIEKDEKYFKIAKNRIEKILSNEK